MNITTLIGCIPRMEIWHRLIMKILLLMCPVLLDQYTIVSDPFSKYVQRSFLQ
ncbi:hypothetical protein CYCME_1433 [Cycloclasticus zancles 78-ME]|uniref:Uncharacterized protein n=1 Tax=Cycloclasticus zancles 78-ME TaxID=1198232 RepID=S5T7K0_9GAMM|nr:hypothetical protein CYCME_1433 [Cycloclasticus zancles 78-ME]